MIIKEHLNITLQGIYSLVGIDKSEIKHCFHIFILHFFSNVTQMNHLGQRTFPWFSNVAKHRAATGLYKAFAGI